MSAPARSDALVLFGATGDLAHKMIFPALQSMVQHGHLDVPVIGVARRLARPRGRRGEETVMSGHRKAST